MSNEGECTLDRIMVADELQRNDLMNGFFTANGLHVQAADECLGELEVCGGDQAEPVG